MKLRRRRFLHLAASAAALWPLLSLPDHGAWAQTTRNFKIVIPLAPGGAGSVVARLLADQRIESLPDIPTGAESGYKDVGVEGWWGLFAPANVPKETVSQLAGWMTAALQLPDVKQKLAVLGTYPIRMCGADFATFLRNQYDELGRAIREANIQAE